MATLQRHTFKTLDGLFHDIQRHSNCPFCRKGDECTQDHIRKKHLKFSVYFQDTDNGDLFTVPCFCGQIKDLKRSHWHCFKCGKILQRLPFFKVHLQNHGCILKEDIPKQLTEKKPERCEERENCPSKPAGEDHFKCTSCQLSFATAGSLRRHERERHERQTDPIYCADVEKGIFITAKSSRGQRVPIHIQKSTTSQVIGCEVEECRDYMTLAKASGMPGLECEHLRRVPHAHPYVAPQSLKHGSIDLMQEKGLISSSRKEECVLINQTAQTQGSCTVFPIFYEEHGYSGRYTYFSVYTGKKDRWCVYGRTRVTFDKLSGCWYCLCKGTKKQYRCVHIYLSMWWLFQEREDLLIDCIRSASEGESSEDEDADVCLEGKDGLTKKQIVAMTTYLWQNKRIPSNLPQELKAQVSPLPVRFEPKETTCPYCPGPTPPGLTEAVVVTKNAVIYDQESIKKGVTVCVKKCLNCKTPVRFQDYETGFHNFNNRILLTIRFCAMMTSALKANTAVGRFLSMMEDLLNVKIHHNTLRKAFFHFWAMTNYCYDFSCVRCGHEPPVLIADANWKVAFDLPVNLLKRPCIDSIQQSDLNVNVDERWSSLEKELIATGFYYDTREKNPFSSDLSCSAFAPWVGAACRAGPVLPKTEVLKGFAERLNDVSPSTSSHAVEDTVLKLLESKKTSKSELVAGCAVLGVSAEGSSSDIINRLEELLLYKEIYPKMFLKLQKAGGGVLHLGCPHSIVYCCSPLWWQESARDHVDALLSFKTPPTVYISDIAGRVARHANNRTRQAFFKPHDGRLCEATEENLARASAKTLLINLPWIQALKEGGPVQRKHDIIEDKFNKRHPITGTSDRCSLYDRFHQRNQKQTKEKLRSLDLVPELSVYINTSMAEQLNRELANCRYFLCQLKDTHFMFALRLVFHLHNSRENQKFMDKIMRHTHEKAQVGIDGRLSLFSAYKNTKDRVKHSESVEESVWKKRKCDSEIAGNRFSISLFPILKENEEKLSELYSVVKNASAVILRVGLCILTMEDLQTLCPAENLGRDSDHGLLPQPWLTDDAVNTRIAQIVSSTQNVVMLPTFVFVCWWRDWITEKKIISRNLSYVKDVKSSDTVIFPRCVQKADNPETGNHFILWVFSGQAQELRVYDSLGLYRNIPDQQMDLLCYAFSHTWNLSQWTLCYPSQWLQSSSDTNNCGVFICTMAEMELKRCSMATEVVGRSQMEHLRRYHAAALAEGVQIEDSMRILGKTTQCMASALHVCCYQSVGEKGAIYKKVVQVRWVQCDLCSGWLHMDCAGVSEPDVKKGKFRCGCDLPQPYTFDSTAKALSQGIDGLISDTEIKALHDALQTEEKKSCRYYLWKHPEVSLKLKQCLKPKQCHFSDDNLVKLADKIKAAVKADNDIENLDYIFDVMIPEVTIAAFMNLENICRYAAEVLMASGQIMVLKFFVGINPEHSKCASKFQESRKTGKMVQRKNESLNPHVASFIRGFIAYDWQN